MGSPPRQRETRQSPKQLQPPASGSRGPPTPPGHRCRPANATPPVPGFKSAFQRQRRGREVPGASPTVDVGGQRTRVLCAAPTAPLALGPESWALKAPWILVSAESERAWL